MSGRWRSRGRCLRPARVPDAVADLAHQRRFRAGRVGKHRRQRGISGRPRSSSLRGPVRDLRHHPPLRIALRRPVFADDLADAAKMLQQRIGAFDGLTASTFSGDRPLEVLAYEFLIGMSRTIDHVDPATATRLLDQGWTWSQWPSRNGCTHARRSSRSIDGAAISSQKPHPDPSARPRTVDVGRGFSGRNLPTLCQRPDDGRADLVPQLCPDPAAGTVQAGPRRPRPTARHVGDIAFAWGFNDLAHFSRIFRLRFGASPREWREHAT